MFVAHAVEFYRTLIPTTDDMFREDGYITK